jgi:hypothetical protein
MSPVHLKLLQARFVTSFVTPDGEPRELKDPHALASPRQLWRLNAEGRLALVQERPRPISKGAAAGAIDLIERKRSRLAARYEREARRIRARLEEVQRDVHAHDAALAFEEHGSWQEAARIAGYRDGSAARQAVELRTDYKDEAGARLARNRQSRLGRLAWLGNAHERRRAGTRVVPAC